MIRNRSKKYALLRIAAGFAFAWTQPAMGAPPKGAVAMTGASAPEPVVSPAARGAQPSLVPVIVIGGAGLAAVGSGVLLANWASNDEAGLDRCAPNCSQESVDRVSNLLLAANLTLGAGVLGLGAATWLYFTQGGSEEAVSAASPRVDVTPRTRGAMATLRGVF